MGAEDYDTELTRLEPEERVSHLDQVADTDLSYPGTYEGEREEVTVTDELITGDEDSAESWLQYNGNLAQDGYSPADRITADNVSELSEAYTVTTPYSGLETNPVVVPGDPPEMYFTSIGPVEEEDGPDNRITVHAVNARTGEELWTSDYGYPNGSSGSLQVNRGVTVYGDNLYIGTQDANVVSFDRETGEQNWSTSVLLEGQSQIRTHITETPIAYDGKIFVGQAGDTAGWSAICAVDAESGEIAWTQRTHDQDGWVADTWKYSSCGAWMTPAVDAETDTLLAAVGNPGPAYNGVVRPGPNNYSDSIMALDPETGEVKWNNQFSPHEVWDWDVHATPQVFDLEVDGETRRAVSHNWKAGWRYILDVETGELITRTEPYARQGGEGFFSPPPLGEENAVEVSPVVYGATEWPPDAYSRNSGLHYVGSLNASQEIWRSNWEYTEDTLDWQGGGTKVASEGTTVEIVAQSAATGETEWTFPLPDVEEGTNPAIAYPGGTTATGGGLVFSGSAGGHMYALDDETGEQLWSADTGGRITASPVVWDDPDAGKQFVAVTSSNKVVVYAAE